MDDNMEIHFTNGNKEIKNKLNFMKNSLAKLDRKELKIRCKIIAVSKVNFFTKRCRFIPGRHDSKSK